MSEAGEIVARLKLDPSDFMAELDRAKVAAEGLDGTDPKITVKADTAAAIGQLKATKAAADDVAAAETRVAAARSLWERATNQATIAEMRLDAARKNSRASAIQIAAATEAYRYANEKATSADEKLTAAEVALTEARKKDAEAAVEEAAAADTAGKKAAGTQQPFTILAATIATLGPGLVPLSAAAVGITFALTGMGAAGVLAVLGIKRAMAEGTTAGLAYQATLTSLQTDLHQLEDTATNALLPGFQAAFGVVQNSMPAINQEVGVLASNLGQMLAPAVDAVVTMFVRLEPAIYASAGYLVNFVKGLDGFAHSKAFGDFVGYALQSLPQFGQLLQNLLVTVGDFLAAMAPYGGTVINILNGILPLVQALTPLAPEIWGVWTAFAVWNGISPLLTGLQGALAKTGATAVTTAAELDTVAAAEARVQAAGGAAVGGAGAGTLGAGAKGLALAAGLGVGLAIGQSNDTIGPNTNQPGSVKVTPQMLAYQASSSGVSGGNSLAGQDAALAKLVSSGNAAKAAQQFDLVKKAAASLNVPISQLNADYPKYAAAVSTAGKASGAAAAAAMQYTSALTAQTPITASLTAAQKAEVLSLRSVAEGFRSTMSAAELLGNTYDDVTIAQGSLIASFQAQAKASKNGKVSLDENTVAGAQNAQQLRGAVDKIKAHADAINADGKHAAEARQYTLEHAKSLEEQATKAGADKSKVDALVGSLIDVSNTKPVSKIDIQTAQAMTQLEALQNKLGSLNGYTAWVYVNLAGTAAAAAGTAGQVARNAIYGKAEGGTIGSAADGITAGYAGTVSGPGTAWNDRAGRYDLANGEEVISNKNGQADRWRPLLKAINSGAADRGAGAGGQDHHVHIHVSGDDSALTQMMRVEVTQAQSARDRQDEFAYQLGMQDRALVAGAPS